MKFQNKNEKLTGMAIPLSSVKTRSNWGFGEFSDIKLLGKWAKKTGLKIIQLLPINDTGLDPSPYNSISAFALNPAYINLEEIDGHEVFRENIDRQKQIFSRLTGNCYSRIYLQKEKILKEIYLSHKDSIIQDKKILHWIQSNDWLKPYCVFKYLGYKKNTFEWGFWGKDRNPDIKLIEKYWTNKSDELNLYAWIQYHANRQLSNSVRFLKRQSVYLKGDIPILMNRNSCDVWFYRRYFHLDKDAGTPPDGDNPDGQNWGFPPYHWENLETDNFDWWISRMKQFSRYYTFARLDHILGFFRIWNIPRINHSGSQGYYDPYCYIYQSELEKSGFDSARIFWMSEPHIQGQVLRQYCKEWVSELKRDFLQQVNNEDLYTFKEGKNSQREIWNSKYPEPVKASLDMFIRNRTLIPLGNGIYFPSWYYTGSQSWQSLSDREKQQLEKLMSKKYEAAESIWETHAHKLLSALSFSSNMQLCAEDLGALNPAVPRVLRDLNIFSLKVIRWNRIYNEENKPFVSPENYPPDSVCTTSVHDSTTFRQWMKDSEEFNLFKNTFNIDKDINKISRKDHFEQILSQIIRVKSEILILPIQDWLLLWPEILPENPEDERINTPGIISENNWAYRIPINLEQILENRILTLTIKKYTKKRKRNKNA